MEWSGDVLDATPAYFQQKSRRVVTKPPRTAIPQPVVALNCDEDRLGPNRQPRQTAWLFAAMFGVTHNAGLQRFEAHPDDLLAFLSHNLKGTAVSTSGAQMTSARVEESSGKPSLPNWLTKWNSLRCLTRSLLNHGHIVVDCHQSFGIASWEEVTGSCARSSPNR